MGGGESGWRIEDEPTLLDCMLEDGELQPEKYQPGKYWRRKTRLAVREIRRCGLHNFRGRDNGVGLSYTDKQDTDVRQSMGVGAQRLLRFMLQRLWPLNKVFDGQVRLSLRISDEGIREKAAVLEASPRVAELRARYRIPYSTGGGTVLWSKLGGVRIANHYLALLDSIEHMRTAGIDFGRVRSLFEIGGGFGINLHLLLENFPNIRKCVYLDIPPNLYVGTQYLKSHFGAAVRDYRATRGAPVRFADDDTLEIACIAPWQIEQLEADIDLFHNAHSFVEMPEPVVANYAGHVERLLRRDGMVALVSYDDFDPATTFHPDRLPSFFKGEFERFQAPMVTSPGTVNFYYLRRGA